MSEIKYLSQSRLSLVLHNNLVFDTTVLLGNMLTCCFVEFQDVVHMFLKIDEEILICEACMFDSLSETAYYLPLRETLPGCDIKINLNRLIEQADQIGS